MDLTHYNRCLPHRLPAGHTFFITFRLAGSLPAEVIERLRDEKHLPEHEAATRRAAGHPDDAYERQRRWFGRFDQSLDSATAGPAFLCQLPFATVLQQAVLFCQQRGDYDLLAYCIMPNHVHVVVALPEEARPLTRTLQSLKRLTATEFNRERGATGQVWHRESYGHRVRNASELFRRVAYTLNNSVQAGRVEDWQKWPHTCWQGP